MALQVWCPLCIWRYCIGSSFKPHMPLLCRHHRHLLPLPLVLLLPPLQLSLLLLIRLHRPSLRLLLLLVHHRLFTIFLHIFGHSHHGYSPCCLYSVDLCVNSCFTTTAHKICNTGAGVCMFVRLYGYVYSYVYMCIYIYVCNVYVCNVYVCMVARHSEEFWDADIWYSPA